MVMNLLETHHVVKKYANHLALDKVSIGVPKGEIFGLLGPNGAGTESPRLTAGRSGSTGTYRSLKMSIKSDICRKKEGFIKK